MLLGRSTSVDSRRTTIVVPTTTSPSQSAGGRYRGAGYDNGADYSGDNGMFTTKSIGASGATAGGHVSHAFRHVGAAVGGGRQAAAEVIIRGEHVVPTSAVLRAPAKAKLY